MPKLYCMFALFFTIGTAVKANAADLVVFEGHAYEFIDTPMAWNDALSFAENKGGTLVQINSFQENTFLTDFLLKTTTSRINWPFRVVGLYSWLGGSDQDLEGAWKWSDGNDVSVSAQTSRSMWGNGPGFGVSQTEPDNYLGAQHCLALGLEQWPAGNSEVGYLGKIGQWNDIDCTNELQFAIEYDYEPKFVDQVLRIPFVAVGDSNFDVSLQIVECDSICFQVISGEVPFVPKPKLAPFYSDNILHLPRVKAGQEVYEVDMELIDPDNLVFVVKSAVNSPSLATYPAADWQLSSPDKVNMDSSKGQIALDYAFAQGQNTQGVVVIRHGVIVAEQYAAGSDKESIATSWSTAKSFNSALMGIAIDKGYVSSEEISAAEFIYEWAGNDKKNMTIKNLLQMSSGLVEQGTSYSGDGAIMYVGVENEDGTNDPNRPVDNILYSINRSVNPSRAPWLGASYNWSYQNADSQVLGEIIERATNSSIYNFAQNVLFSKLGINADWWTDAFGNYMAYCCLDMTTRDFARFGLLYAREGKWNTEQVVSKEWVVKSTAPSVWVSGTVPWGYGYQWWADNSGDWYYALGSRSNNIYVHPGLDIVVVRNSSLEFVGEGKSRATGAYHKTEFPAAWYHYDFMLPIIESATGLQESPGPLLQPY